jgi:uncharacterized protein YggE
MKLKFTLLCSLFFIISTAIGQTSTVEAPKISAAGVGMVSAFPNAAQITLALRFTKPTLREAVNENQQTAKQVLAVVKKYVVDTTTVKVSLIATDKSMKWNNALKKDVFVGFESSQKIIFTLTDLKAMQNFTEDILKTRIYEIETVSYFHTDGASFVKQAQELAVADAIETSKRIAKAANVKLGSIIYIETQSSPANAVNNRAESERFQTYNKSMGGEGVSSSGQLLNFVADVNVYTKIVD